MEVEVFSTSGLILIFIGLFLALAVGIGLVFKKKIDGQADFATAGRSLNWMYVTASVVATWIGAAVILGGAGEVYNYGFQGIVWDPWAPMLTLVIAGLFFVKRLRRTKHVTVGDFYNSRYGRQMDIIFSVAQAVTGLAWLAAQFKSFGVLIHMTTGFPEQLAIIIGVIVITFVAMSGGLWALSRTDMISFIIITISLLVMVPYAFSAVGGVSSFIANAGNLNDLPQWSLWYSSAVDEVGDPYGMYWYGGILGVFYAVSGWIAVGIGDLGGPILNARALAAKTEKDASIGFIAGGFIYLILGMIPVIIGVAAYIVTQGGMPAESLDYILPWFVQNYMPAWVGIMFMVSLAAAIVSTAGDTILVEATIVTNALYRKIRPDISDKEILGKLKWALPIFAVLAYLVTFAGGIYDLLVFAGAALFPTISASYIFGIFWKKANHTGALASFYAGIGSWLVFTFAIFVPAATNYFDEGVSLFRDWGYIVSEGYMEDAVYIAAVPAFAVSVLAMIVVSLMTQKSDPPKLAVDADGVAL